MSLLGILLSGLLSVVLWFEVSRSDTLTSKERGSFIGGSIVETLFFFISIVGLLGAIVRKLSFVTAYAIGLYIHFLINLSVASYLLFVILHATNTDTVTLCQNVLKNEQAKDQCDSLFDSIRGLYAGLASFVLVVELYGAIIATRYFYQLRGEKREARMPKHMRLPSDSGRLLPGFVRYREASGATVYNSHFYPPMKGHTRGASAYSLAGSDFEGTMPVGLYDPPSAGLHDMKNHEALGFEDEFQDDDHQDHGYGDHDGVSPRESFETVQGGASGIESRE
jgi:hypothetical protein